MLKKEELHFYKVTKIQVTIINDIMYQKNMLEIHHKYIDKNLPIYCNLKGISILRYMGGNPGKSGLN